MQGIGRSAGKSFAYLLGVYLGDGCVTKGGKQLHFRLNTIDQDFAEAVKSAIADVSNKYVGICKHAVKRSPKPNYSLFCADTVLCQRMVDATDAKAVLPIPDSREEKIAMIEGLMDSEGFIAATRNPTNRRYFMGYKSCDPWVRDFIGLLESVGIRTGKIGIEKPRKPGYKTPMRFHVKMQSWIDSGARFRIARKQKKVEEWASAGPYERRAKFPRRLTSEANTLGAPKER